MSPDGSELLTLFGQVVMAVVRTIVYVGPASQHPKAVEPLLRLLHTSHEVERVVLENLLVIAKEFPVRASFTRCLALLKLAGPPTDSIATSCRTPLHPSPRPIASKKGEASVTGVSPDDRYSTVFTCGVQGKSLHCFTFSRD